MKAELVDAEARMMDTHWWFRGRRRVIRAIADGFLPPRDGLVVDLGCGVGAITAAFVTTHHCIGFDVSPAVIAHARARLPAGTFLQGDVREVPEVVAEADVVLLTDVLEHVAGDGDLLASVVTAMRPDAILVVTVPAGPGSWSGHDVALGHLRRYDAASLRSLWESLPVREELVSPFNARLYWFARAVRASRRLTGWLGTGSVESDLRPVPRPLNAVLGRIFSGERHRLSRALAGRGRAYRRGLSLIAVVRRVGP